MRISDFDYELPTEQIAQFPPKVRGSTRLLALNRQTGAMDHKYYQDLADYLEPGDLVVLNNTKVIKARLTAVNAKGQPRELLLLEDHGQNDPRMRLAVYRGSLREHEILQIENVKIRVEKVLDGGLVQISSSNDLLELAEQYGKVPLPPYMKRQATPDDQKRYQTEFAKTAGSVAAPTASLNFTKNLVDKLTTRKIDICYLTLHVGLGTFLPIRTDNVEAHHMHSEYFTIPTDTIQAIQSTKQAGRKVCAVGTTVARTLEYAADQILQHPAAPLSGEADIFIYPGYDFKITDVLLTNFHAPRSTVLMLTAAFASWPKLQKAYQSALAEDYKFLSYGDSMLIF